MLEKPRDYTVENVASGAEALKRDEYSIKN
jgi:hypothetical protein